MMTVNDYDRVTARLRSRLLFSVILPPRFQILQAFFDGICRRNRPAKLRWRNRLVSQIVCGILKQAAWVPHRTGLRRVAN